ncbi:hypothetical protein BRARA_A02715 [Brassica rapa]|uniref:N-acetyltransferase domain-containing protein n=1 Tax=Brassica campestris TaxID=3711 RepID=A0A398AQL6_BRACM|nr:hypothetical protein BRARA_A02715 [Brassica rapa]
MESPKIFLRSFNLSDAEDVLKWAGDDDVTRYLRWDSVKIYRRSPTTHRPEGYMTISHPWRRSISLLDDGRPIGCVSIRPDSGDEFWGRGIATAAVRMAVDQSFEVFSGGVENIASQKVLEKVGFEKEGLLKKYGFCKGVVRDMFLYSFVKYDK